MGKYNTMHNINNKKICAIIAIMLITLCFVPLCFARIGDQAPSSRVSVPGVPTDSVQFDLTGMTPLQDVEQVSSMLMHVFAYRNVTLMLNSTRNMELDVTVDAQVKPRIFSLYVESNQNVSLVIDLKSSPSFGVAIMERNLNVYLDIEPNAPLELQAQLKLNINSTELNQELNRAVDTSKLTWMYWNTIEQKWVPVESYMDDNGYLVCNTTHFSTWTVAETETNQLPEPTVTPAPTSTPASSSSPSISPSESAQPSLSASPSPSQAASPMQSLLPSPSQSTITEQESTSSTNTPTEYIYPAIAVAIVAVVAVSIVIIKKKAK